MAFYPIGGGTPTVFPLVVYPIFNSALCGTSYSPKPEPTLARGCAQSTLRANTRWAFSVETWLLFLPTPDSHLLNRRSRSLPWPCAMRRARAACCYAARSLRLPWLCSRVVSCHRGHHAAVVHDRRFNFFSAACRGPNTLVLERPPDYAGGLAEDRGKIFSPASASEIGNGCRSVRSQEVATSNPLQRHPAESFEGVVPAIGFESRIPSQRSPPKRPR